VNDKVPGPVPRGHYDASKAATAAALLAAGEALVRASNALSAGVVHAPSRAADRKAVPLPVAERLSAKQLGAIRAASRRAGLSRDALSDLLAEIAGKEEAAQLSRAEASAVLDKLSSMTGYQR
jgi:hypothetical protein